MPRLGTLGRRDSRKAERDTKAPRHQKIIAALIESFAAYLRRQPIGDVFPDLAFSLAPDTRCRPDVAIVLHENWRALNLDVSPVPLAPDLAVEVVSPYERTVESTRKIRMYLNNGVTEVWQIFPITGDLLVYRCGMTIEIYRTPETMRTPLLPEWQMAVSNIVGLEQMLQS